MPCAHRNVHLGRIGDRRVTHPQRDFLEIEAPDATDLKGRNLVRFDELIDRSLLDSQQIRQFLDGQDVLFPIHYDSPYSPHGFKRGFQDCERFEFGTIALSAWAVRSSAPIRSRPNGAEFDTSVRASHSTDHLCAIKTALVS